MSYIYREASTTNPDDEDEGVSGEGRLVEPEELGDDYFDKEEPDENEEDNNY